MPDKVVSSLKHWLCSEGIYLHPALDIVEDEENGSGLRIIKFPGSEAIHQHDLLAQIPLTALLSSKSSSLTRNEALTTLPPNVELAVHLLHEMCQGERSRWYAYFSAFGKPPCLPFTWTLQAKEWVSGTELEYLASQQWEGFDTTRLRKLFTEGQVVKTLHLQSAHYVQQPTESLFIAAFCFVQSRAFWVDAYHRLALVPLADL